MAGINPQLILNVLPSIISGVSDSIRSVNDSYKQQVETYMQKKKEFQDLVMKDLQSKREAQKKMFEQIKKSDNQKQEKQQSIGEAWAQALGMDSWSTES